MSQTTFSTHFIFSRALSCVELLSPVVHISMLDSCVISTFGLMSDPSIKSLNSLKVQAGPASNVL